MKIDKLFTKFLVLSLSVLILTGCNNQSGQVINPQINPKEEPTADQFEKVRQAAEDYLASEKVTAFTPEQLYEEFIVNKNGEYVVVDIRAKADFAAKNIRGSINIPYSETIKKLSNLPQDKTMIVVDYNGHWAAQTAATWNLLGFKAVPLLYGMQSWTDDQSVLAYEPFPAEPLNNPLVKEETALGEYSLPELVVPEGTVEEIIERLSAIYLNRNYKGYVPAEEVSENLSGGEQYFVDIRSPEHYAKGHIEGSVNIPLNSLASVDMLKFLPLDKEIVLVGYNGMDASQGVRTLVILGYDAVALKYGMSYWHGDEDVTGVSPVRSLVQDHYELIPLNYVQPSAGPAGCG